MKNRLVFCSDHIKEGFSLDDAIKYSISNNSFLEVHGVHFKELFLLKKIHPIIAIHPHWRDYSLSTDDNKYFRKSIDYLKNLIDFISKNDIKYLILHPEGYPVNLDKETRYEIVIGAFQQLSKYINKNDNITILLENMPPAKIYSPSDLPDYYIGEKLKDLFQILNINTKIEFLFDLGHFICAHNIYGDKEIKDLEKFDKKLTYVHVHDNNGKINNHEPLSREETIKILEKIEEKYNPLYSLEVSPSIENLNKSIRILKKLNIKFL